MYNAFSYDEIQDFTAFPIVYMHGHSLLRQVFHELTTKEHATQRFLVQFSMPCKGADLQETVL